MGFSIHLASHLVPLAVCLIIARANAQIGTYVKNDSDGNENSSAYLPGRDTWQDIAETVLCSAGGSDQNKATAVRASLHEYDGGSNWIVFVTPPEKGAAWSWGSGWEVLDRRNLCGSDLAVFKKSLSSTHCTTDLKEEIMVLIHSAAQDGSDYASVRDLVLSRESMLGLGHHVVFTLSYGGWSTWDRSACQNYDDSQDIAVFYYGFSTVHQDEKNEMKAVVNDNNHY